MISKSILKKNIIEKIAKKTGRNIASIRVSVCKKASKLGISSEAALVVLAKEYDIGTSIYQRSLDAIKKAEIRDMLPTILSSNFYRKTSKNQKNRKSNKPIINKRTYLKVAIEYLIEDQKLLNRCLDILMASRNFDRPINQATLVLEDRIRRKAQPVQKLVGENLVNYAFKEDLSRTVLRVASNDSDDQRGFTQILRGVVPAFRNKTHHHITEKFSREDAIRVCGFIDVLLRIVDNSVKVR